MSASSSYEFPMRVILVSGAELLVQDRGQSNVIPDNVALQPTGARDEQGRAIYRELNPQDAAMAIVRRLDLELGAAADALDQAAEWMRSGQVTPHKTSQVKQSATRARQAHLEIAGAVNA